MSLVVLATLLVAGCSTGRQTSIATLITSGDRARATTISKERTSSEAATARPPLRRALAASGNVLLPIQFVRGPSGPGGSHLQLTAPGASLGAGLGGGNGAQVAADTPLVTASVRSSGLSNPGAARTAGAALTTPLGVSAAAGLTPAGANANVSTSVAGVALGTSAASGVNANVSTPVGSAALGVSAPAGATVVTGHLLSPVLPAASTAGVGIASPAAAGLLSPVAPVVTGVASGVSSAAAPLVQGTSAGVASLLGRIGG